MKGRWIHPLWTHLPALCLIFGSIVWLFLHGPLPDSVPVHFSFEGIPDRIGSPWEVILAVVGLSLAFVVGSAFIDEAWARQEDKKRFNWYALLDEVVVGFMAALLVYSVIELPRQQVLNLDPGWLQLGIGGLTGLALGVLVELLRPYHHFDQVAPSGDYDVALAYFGRLSQSGRFSHSEWQNPSWFNIILVVSSAAVFIAAAYNWQASRMLSLILICFGIGIILLAGGIRVEMDERNFKIKFGLLGIRLLRLRPGEIAESKVHQFAPLRDFAGWGIRYNGQVWAYFMRGCRGVLIVSKGGRKFVVGSDDPERLAAALAVFSADKKVGV